MFLYDGNMEQLHNLTDENFDGAFMVISQIVDFFNVQHFPNIKILKTKQYVQLMPFSMFFRKHSCLLKPFNDQINLFSSSGLIAAWAKHYEKSAFKSDSMEPKALSIDQISGVITVCICLIAASLILFILELMSTSHEAVQFILDFFTFKAQPRRKFAMIQRKKHSNHINQH